MGSPFAALGSLQIFGTNRETLSANKTIVATDKIIQSYDPAAARDITLPAEAVGLTYFIVNRSNGAEDLTLKNDAGTTLGTISEDEAALVVCDGTGWVVVLGATMTIQS